MSETMVGTDVFLRDALALETLAAYGSGVLPDLPDEVRSRFRDEVAQFITSKAGRAEVAEWGHLFQGTLAELGTLRNAVAHRPEWVTVRDLQEGVLAEQRAFEGLTSWLEAVIRAVQSQAS